MVSTLRITNIAETGHSVSVHLRRISNGYIVNSSGLEEHYSTLDEAETAFRAKAQEQKEKVINDLSTQIENIEKALSSINDLYEDALADAEKQLEQIHSKEG